MSKDTRQPLDGIIMLVIMLDVHRRRESQPAAAEVSLPQEGHRALAVAGVFNQQRQDPSSKPMQLGSQALPRRGHRKSSEIG